MKEFGEAGASLSSNVVNSRGNTQAVEETESTIKSSIELYTSDNSLTPSGTLSENASKIATLINKAASTDSGKASIIASLQKESDMSAEDYNDKLAGKFGYVINNVLGDQISTVVDNIKGSMDSLIAEVEEPEIKQLLEEVKTGLEEIDSANVADEIGGFVADVFGLTIDTEENSEAKATYGNVATLMVVDGLISSVTEQLQEQGVEQMSFESSSVVINLVNSILPAMGAIDIASGTSFKNFLQQAIDVLPALMES